MELIRPPALHSALPAPRSLSPAGLSAAGAGSPPWCDRVPAPSRERRCHRRRSVSIRGVTASTPARPDTRPPLDSTSGRAAAGAGRRGSGPRPPSPRRTPRWALRLRAGPRRRPARLPAAAPPAHCRPHRARSRDPRAPPSPLGGEHAWPPPRVMRLLEHPREPSQGCPRRRPHQALPLRPASLRSERRCNLTPDQGRVLHGVVPRPSGPLCVCLSLLLCEMGE